LRAVTSEGLAAPRSVAWLCAFLAMLAFSITLRDRLADALFAVTAVAFDVSRFIDTL
jgi:hypothetical protein